MTETETKTKWCPFTHTRDPEKSRCCVGQNCALWIWALGDRAASDGHGYCGAISQ